MTALEHPDLTLDSIFTSETLPAAGQVSQTAAAQVLRSSVLDPLTGSEWDRVVASHADATIFHAAAWAKVLRDTYRHTPYYVRLADAKGETAAVLPLMEVSSRLTGRRGVALPFSDLCGPLVFTPNISESVIVDAFATIADERRWKYVELRGAAIAAEPHESYYAHRLDVTPAPEDLFSNCTSAFRRAVRKAEQSGVDIEISRELDAVRQFYALHARTRRRHGIPPQPFSFFRNIHAHLLKPGLGFIVLASSGATPLAAAMFFHFNGNALFKFGASDERHQQQRASNLVMWEGIRQCAALGARTLHLGRTDLPQDGLRRFKLSLGATEETLHYFRYDPAKRRWLPKSLAKRWSAHTAVFRRLPLTVNQLAGTMLYPHLH